MEKEIKDKRQNIMKNQIHINNEHLRELENEAIFVMREVAAQFENKVLVVFRRKGFNCTGSSCKESILACKNSFHPDAY